MTVTSTPSADDRRATYYRRRRARDRSCPFSGKNRAQRQRLSSAFNAMQSCHNTPLHRLPFFR